MKPANDAISISGLVKTFGPIRALDGLDKKRKADLLERFYLDPRKKGRACSKGNRQKVALIAALAFDVGYSSSPDDRGQPCPLRR